MMHTAKTKRRYDPAVRRNKTARGAFAVVLACVLAGALVIALTSGPASAASRGFVLNNNSDHALKLFAVKPVPTFLCADPSRCVQTTYPIDFEGRPPDGDVLNPGN